MSESVKLKSGRFKTVAAIFVFLMVVFGGIYFVRGLGDNRGYSPVQPVPFSHKLHAGDMKIECQYCHSEVDKSRHANVPSMNVCMNCHSVVAQESPHIKKMRDLIQSGNSFEWIKVNDLPDYVFFNHKRHVAKDISCETCHGDVRAMDRVTQMQKLNMGFCVNCHREKEASTGCDTCHH